MEIYNFKELKRNIKNTVLNFQKCQLNKHFRNNIGKINNKIYTDEPFLHIILDIIKPYRIKFINTLYIVTFTDRWTRYTKVKCILKQTAIDVMNDYKKTCISEMIIHKYILMNQSHTIYKFWFCKTQWSKRK